MRSYGLHRSSISRYMGRSSFKRSSIGRRNTYKVSGSTFKSYLAEAQKIAYEIEAAKDEGASGTSKSSRTKAKDYTTTGSRFNSGVTDMNNAANAVREQLDADTPDLEKTYDEAVKFADGYNDMFAAVRNSSGSAVSSKVRYISDVTKLFSRALGEIGITADKNGDLSVDKEKFIKSDIKDISKIFEGKSSFAALVKEQTDSISVLSSLSADTYSGSSTAAYSSAMSGSIFNRKL